MPEQVKQISQDYIIKHDQQKTCIKGIALKGRKVALLFEHKILIVSPYTSTIQNSYDFQQKMDDIIGTQSGIVAGNSKRLVVIQQNKQIINHIFPKQLQYVDHTLKLKLFYFKNSDSILAVILSTSKSKLICFRLSKNTLTPAIKFDITQAVSLMKIDDTGFVYDLKNNKFITSSNQISNETHTNSFKKLMIEKYGDVCQDKYEQHMCWYINQTTMVLKIRAKMNNIRIKSIIAFPEYLIERKQDLQSFIFSNQKSNTIGFLLHKQNWSVQIFNYSSRQTLQKVPLLLSSSINSICIDRSYLVEVRKNKQPKTLKLTIRPLYDAKKWIMHVFCNSYLSNKYSESLIRKVFQILE